METGGTRTPAERKHSKACLSTGPSVELTELEPHSPPVEKIGGRPLKLAPPKPTKHSGPMASRRYTLLIKAEYEHRGNPGVVHREAFKMLNTSVHDSSTQPKLSIRVRNPWSGFQKEKSCPNKIRARIKGRFVHCGPKSCHSARAVGLRPRKDTKSHELKRQSLIDKRASKASG